MFTKEMRAEYERNGHAKSGSRPSLGAPRGQKEIRFRPLWQNSQEQLARWAGFTRGVRQVVRHDGRLEPKF